MALVDAALHVTERKDPSLVEGKGLCSEPVVQDELAKGTLGRGSIGTPTSPSRLATDSRMTLRKTGLGRRDGEFSAEEYGSFSKDNDVFRELVGVGEQNGGREQQAW